MPKSADDRAFDKRISALADAADAAREEAAALARKLERHEETIAALKASTSWRVTTPLRVASRLIRRATGRAEPAPAPRELILPEFRTPTTHAPAALFGPRVVIVAELSLAQCAKYRVWQKQASLGLLGVPCTVVAWPEYEAVRNALQTASLAIFYRSPGYPEVLEAIAEARRLRVPTLWEADDLIFDEAAYRKNRNLEHLDPELRDSVLSGIPLYLAALRACDGGLASTEELAAAMRAAGTPQTFVVENGLDAETLGLADEILARRAQSPRRRDRVTILYGSGSKAHDADFQQAAPGLVAAMQAVPELHLRVVGALNLPPALDAFADRVERLPAVDYASYLRLLGEADISLAPLEATDFSDAKSNIKFLEAAVLEIPSVVSPRAAFRGAVEHGRTGFLAGDDGGWAEALVALARDETLRLRIGRAAAEAARARYGPEAVAQTQVQPLVQALAPEPARDRLRVLAVNIHFSPQSFGGATIVAEAMAERLARHDDMEVAVFTAWPTGEVPAYALQRWEAKGVPVLGVRLPDHVSEVMQYDNPRMGRLFADVLEALRPDVVHLHSIQGLGAGLADACRAAGVPYVVTLHDSWWLCERQFMIRPDDRYCFQERIDWAVCGRCVKDLGFSIRRRERLREALDGAAMLLTPSTFHRALHLANGVAPDRIVVNKNGIAPPAPRPRARSDEDPLRFGFVGGAGPIKGIELIRRAFEALPDANYELVLVDNTLNLGYSSIEVEDWRVRGRIRVVPAYSQAELDDFFACIDVLLFPSQWKESFGLTVREALARDVWVIATDAGGAAEDIVEGENGVVVPIGDDEGPLREAIASLLHHPERLSGYENPYKGRLVTVDDQAARLASLLREAAGSAAG